MLEQTAKLKLTTETNSCSQGTDLVAEVSAQCHSDQDTDTATLLSNVTHTSTVYNHHNNDDDDDASLSVRNS